MFVTKFYEYFDKFTAFDCKFNSVWINFCFCCYHELKVPNLSLSIILNIILTLKKKKKLNELSFCSILKTDDLIVS